MDAIIIRHGRLIYERLLVDVPDPTEEQPARTKKVRSERYSLVQTFSSISKAKHWSREQPSGTVRRFESLAREHGAKVVNQRIRGE